MFTAAPVLSQCYKRGNYLVQQFDEMFQNNDCSNPF
jgi:hypothetical protein